MKKIFSLLSTISLSTIISTNIIACNAKNENNKPNTNNNETEKQFTPQQPREKSNWKLIDINSSDWISSKEFNNNKNKWYIMFAKKEDTNNFNFISFKNNDINKLWSLGNKGSFNISLKNEWYWFNWLYRWDGVGEPTIPTINKDTDEITNWNEKIES